MMASGDTEHPIPDDPGPLATIPERVGRFELGELIGGGGLGSVYRARQTKPVQRDAAVKFLRVAVDDASREGLLAEGRALALMNHPNIVRLFEAGFWFDRPYFAMELVAGGPIAEYCDSNRFTIEERLGLFLQVCEAIRYIHKRKVVHRDLTPSNVLIVYPDRLWQSGNGEPTGNHVLATGSVKVIDFSIAVSLDPAVTLSDGKIRAGTKGFMAPEVVRGDPVENAYAIDVYGLGTLLFVFLCGNVGEIPDGPNRRPTSYMKSLGETAARVAEMRGTQEHKLIKRLSGDLEKIVTKALEPSPKDRYQNVGELEDHIRRHLRNEPLKWGTENILSRIIKSVRQVLVGERGAAAPPRLFFFLAVICAGLLAWSTVVLLLDRKRTLTQLEKANERINHTKREVQELTQNRDKDRRLTYAAQTTNIQGMIQSRQLSSARRALASCPQDCRGWEWRKLSLYADMSSERLGLSRAGFTKWVSSESRNRFASMILAGARDGSVWCWRRENGVPKFTFTKKPHSAPIVDLVVQSETESAISIAADGTVCQWSVETGKIQNLEPFAPEKPQNQGNEGMVPTRQFSSALSPDGRLLCWLGQGFARIIPVVFGNPADREKKTEELIYNGKPLASRDMQAYWGGSEDSPRLYTLRFIDQRLTLISWKFDDGARPSADKVWFPFTVDEKPAGQPPAPPPSLAPDVLFRASKDFLMIGQGANRYLYDLRSLPTGAPGREDQTKAQPVRFKGERMVSLGFSPDESKIGVGGGQSDDLQLINYPSTGSHDDELDFHGHEDAILQVKFESGDWVRTASLDGTLRRWNSNRRPDHKHLMLPLENTSERPSPKEASPQQSVSAHEMNKVLKVRFGGEAAAAGLVAATKRSIFYWKLNANGQNIDVTGRDTRVKLTLEAPEKTEEKIGDVAISANGTVVAAIGLHPGRRRLLVWNLPSTVCQGIENLNDPTDPDDAVAVSKDGEYVAVGDTLNNQPTLRLWRRKVSGKLEYEKAARELPECKDTVAAIDFSANGEWLVAACRKSLTIWNVGKPQDIQVHWQEQFPNYTLKTVRFGPDSQTIVIGTEEGYVLVCDLVTKKVTRSFLAHVRASYNRSQWAPSAITPGS